MAKGKQAAALFEVISKSRRYQRPVETRSSTPSWWPFGRRKGPAPIVPAKSLNAPVMGQVGGSPRAAGRQLEVMDTSHDTHTAASEQQVSERDWDARAAASTLSSLPGVETPLHKPLEYAVDPERRVIAFRMNYTVAIVGGFAAVIAVALAVIVGQHIRGEGAPVLTPSITSLQSGPAHPGVMEIPRRAQYDRKGP